MKKYLLVVFISMAAGSSVWSQDAYDRQKALSSEALFFKKNGKKNTPANPGENYLVLDKAPRLGKFRRYRFFIGDQVKFRLHNNRIRFKSEILSISDSSFTIEDETIGRIDRREILLKDLRLFKVSKRIPFVTEAAYYFPIAGLLYIGADFVNNGINNKNFTTDASAFVVGGALMVAGFVCYKLSFTSIRVNDRNRLKVLKNY